MELLIASNNYGKVGEISQFLLDLPIKIYSLKDWAKQNNIPNVPDPEENGTSYFDNALIKAQACYTWSGLPCLADDTGLEVLSLSGEPGLYTARYAGLNCSYDDNVNKLIRELAEKEDRRAIFKACLVFFDGQATQAFYGELSGVIGYEKKGCGGFGYDPIFFPDQQEKSLAELKMASNIFPTHRIRALLQFKEYLLKRIDN